MAENIGIDRIAIRLLIGCAAFSAAVLTAQTVPTTLNYQGRVTDNTPQQNPMNGSSQFVFALYDAPTGGSKLWEEPSSGAIPVMVNNGIFSVLLGGNGEPLSSTVFSGGATRYLQVTFNGENLTPRQTLSATGYAHQAENANLAISALASTTALNALNLGGLPAANYLLTTGIAYDSNQLGGMPANQFVLTSDPRLSDARAPTAGSGNYIQNGTTQQTANFNISGNGTLAGALTAGSFIGPGSGLTNLNAAALSTNTVPSARLPATLLNTGDNVSRLANDAGYLTQSSGDARYATLRPTPRQLATLRWYGVNQALPQTSAGANPYLMACDGENVWVSNVGGSTVTKIRVLDGVALGTYPVGSSPVGLVFDGAFIWVANQGSNNVMKLRIADKSIVGTYAVGSTPAWLAFDGANIWSANVASFNVTKLRASDGSSIGTYPVGSNPIGLAFDGNNLWVTNSGDNTVSKLNVSTGAVIGTYSVGINPRSVVFDGTYIWTTNLNTNTVSRLLASNGSSAGSFIVGSQPRGMVFDGVAIWVANNGDNTVTRLRASDGSLLGTYPTGSGPFGLTFDGSSVWVSNTGSNTVSHF